MKSLFSGLAVLLLLSGAAVVWSAYKLVERAENQSGSEVASETTPAADQKEVTEFTLTERSGEPFGTKDLKGQVWVGSFFFSSCPGTCRTQNLHLLSLTRKYGPEGVKFVSITCDPKVDTPAKLSEYADSFQAKKDAWYFLTGDLDYIRRIGQEYFKVYVDEKGHMDRFMVVDKWGKVRGYYDWRDPTKLEELGDKIDELQHEEKEPTPATT